MAIYPAPAVVLIPSLLAGLALAARGALARRQPAQRPGLRVPVAAVLVALLLGVASASWFDTPDRRWPVWLGLALGAALGSLWEWLWPPHEADAAELGPLGAGLAVLAALGLALTPGVPLANASLGLLASWGTVQLLAGLMPRDQASLAGSEAPLAPLRHTGLALAALALAAGGAAWGARLPVHNEEVSGLWPLAIGLAACAALGLAVSELVGTRRSGAAGAAVAAVVFALAGGALAFGGFGAQGALLAGLAAGGLGGFLGGLLLPAEGAPPRVAGLAYMIAVGALLVVENRLTGILAIAFGGLGLLAGSRGARGPRGLVALALAICAVRVWLQLFLDRTNLTGYGIDLTHPYAFASLVVGGLLPAAAVAIARHARPLPSLSVGWALALAALPAWLGYLIHVEALGGLLAGLLLASFTLGTAGSREDEGLEELLAPLLMLTLAVTMLSAPWLVEHMNAPRDERVKGFLASFVLVAAWLARWGLAQRQRV